MTANHWRQQFAGKSDAELADYADHYADSRNFPMLAVVQALQAERRQLAAHYEATLVTIEANPHGLRPEAQAQARAACQRQLNQVRGAA